MAKALLLVLALAAAALAAPTSWLVPDALIEDEVDFQAAGEMHVMLRDGEAPQGTFERIQMVHAGLDRVYVLYTPVNVPANASMMLLIHYALGSPIMVEMFARMASVADEYGYVIAYPRGLDRTFYAGPMCCGGWEERDDVGFMRAIVADVAERRSINTRRVYSGGLSNGGYMSYRLACDASDLVAAIAPIAAGSPWARHLEHCNPSRPVPTLHMHGTKDRLVSYDFGLQTFQDTLKLYGCVSPGVISLREGVTTCESFTNCATPGLNMTFCTAEGAGHLYWPGSDSIFVPDNYDMYASREMLSFFNKYSL